MHLFFALADSLCYTCTVADTANAFQQSPPPTVPCFHEIDNGYASWYLKKFGRPIDRHKHVIPIGRAIQGHPEAGNLWEGNIVDFLCNQLGFRATTHEPNLYCGTVDGKDTLVCRQVHDFNIATKDHAAAEKLIALINSFITTESKGLAPRYNGVNILQTRTTSSFPAMARLLLVPMNPIVMTPF
jgi:hypothetical protein